MSKCREGSWRASNIGAKGAEVYLLVDHIRGGDMYGKDGNSRRPRIKKRDKQRGCAFSPVTTVTFALCASSFSKNLFSHKLLRQLAKGLSVTRCHPMLC